MKNLGIILLGALFVTSGVYPASAAWQLDPEARTISNGEGCVLNVIIQAERQTLSIGLGQKDKATGFHATSTVFSPVDLSSGVEGYTIEEIGDYAFYQDVRLQEIILPEGLIRIGKYAFAQGPAKDEKVVCTTGVQQLQMPNSLQVIDESAFNRCGGLACGFRDLIPEGVKTIGANAFRSCTGIASGPLRLAELTTLDDRAFAYNESILAVELPQISTFGESVFNGCTRAKNFYFYSDEIVFDQWQIFGANTAYYRFFGQAPKNPGLNTSENRHVVLCSLTSENEVGWRTLGNVQDLTKVTNVFKTAVAALKLQEVTWLGAYTNAKYTSATPIVAVTPEELLGKESFWYARQGVWQASENWLPSVRPSNQLSEVVFAPSVACSEVSCQGERVQALSLRQEARRLTLRDGQLEVAANVVFSNETFLTAFSITGQTLTVFSPLYVTLAATAKPVLQGHKLVLKEGSSLRIDATSLPPVTAEIPLIQMATKIDQGEALLARTEILAPPYTQPSLVLADEGRSLVLRLERSDKRQVSFEMESASLLDLVVKVNGDDVLLDEPILCSVGDEICLQPKAWISLPFFTVHVNGVALQPESQWRFRFQVAEEDLVVRVALETLDDQTEVEQLAQAVVQRLGQEPIASATLVAQVAAKLKEVPNPAKVAEWLVKREFSLAQVVAAKGFGWSAALQDTALFEGEEPMVQIKSIAVSGRTNPELVVTFVVGNQARTAVVGDELSAKKYFCKAAKVRSSLEKDAPLLAVTQRGEAQVGSSLMKLVVSLPKQCAQAFLSFEL